MDKNINNNGYDYVDLELPSGTLWATMNVGASSPSESGLYFQWGEIKGYTKEQIGKEKKFEYDFSDYKFSIDGSNTNFSKYIKEGAISELEDDAAHVNMGGIWHMPTPDQISELIYNTTSEWVELDGVNGRLFTSNKDTSKSIFIPAAGGAMDGSVFTNGYDGFAWSSMLSTILVGYGQSIYFNSEYIYLSYNFFSRCNGFPVRGVIG